MQTIDSKHGFTLVELAIVIVIIALVTGAVLVGRDLIASAEVRAQISQIDKFDKSARLFQTKYGDLPGDITDPAATSFGFMQRGPARGQGDGNGVIEGTVAGCGTMTPGINEAQGETIAFWEDLSVANLIDGRYAVLSLDPGYAGGSIMIYYPPLITLTSSPSVKDLLPMAKLGKDNYVYVWSENGTNYYGLSSVTMSACFEVYSTPGITVQQAYDIDQKIDDGMPLTGHVLARYLNAAQNSLAPVWAGPADNSATTGSDTSCYDNNGVAGTAQHYSLDQNKGTGLNCGMSFTFQ